jgi:hypothetical protein
MNQVSDPGLDGRRQLVRPEEPAVLGETPGEALDPVEALVLGSMTSGTSGFTIRQLQTFTHLPVDEIEKAIQRLNEKRLVARLNTVIPSYSCRYPGVGV